MTTPPPLAWPSNGNHSLRSLSPQVADKSLPGRDVEELEQLLGPFLDGSILHAGHPAEVRHRLRDGEALAERQLLGHIDTIQVSFPQAQVQVRKSHQETEIVAKANGSQKTVYRRVILVALDVVFTPIQFQNGRLVLRSEA